jgi:hypothetical protein
VSSASIRIPSSNAASVPAATALTATAVLTGQIGQPVNGSAPRAAARMVAAKLS